MTSLRSCAWTASMACLVLASGLKAGENHPGHNPTYFGRPGSGPSGPVYKYDHPSTYSWFGTSAHEDPPRLNRPRSIANTASRWASTWRR